MIKRCIGCYYHNNKENVCTHGSPIFLDDVCTDYRNSEFVMQIRAEVIDECIGLLRQGMNELLESPWANKSYMSNHDFEVRKVFEIIDDLIIKKDLEQLKEE